MADFESDWPGRGRVLYQIVHRLITFIVAAHILRISVEDEHLIPESGPVILMSNHQSNLDPLLLGWAARRPLNMPAKIELFRIPILKQFIEGLGSYPVDRDARDSASLRRSLSVLRQGRVLAVFPEGTRSRTGEVGPFTTMLTRLAMREGAPIVPVSMTGTGAILPPGKRLPALRSKIVIRFGSPVDLSGWAGRRPTDHDLKRSTEEIRRRVIELSHHAIP